MKATNAKTTDPMLTERKQQLLELTGALCDARLNADYKRLCKKAVERLAKQRPSPILRGKPEIWAAGIVHALGSANFLFDKSLEPYMSAGDIAAWFQVASGSASQKATAVRDTLRIAQLDPEWMTKQMQERFSSTFAMMEEMTELMGGLAPGEIRPMGGQEGSPLAMLTALLGGNAEMKWREQDSLEDGEFIARDTLVSEEFYTLGEQYESGRGIPKVLESGLRKLIARDPDFYDPYLMLRDLLGNTGREAEGEALLAEAYRRAIARITDADGAWPASLQWGWIENRHLIRTLLNQALALWTAGDNEAALDLLRKLLRANPNDNIGAREYILAIRMGQTFEGFERTFLGAYGYDAMKMSDWFDKNSPRFPDEFDWWKQAVRYNEE